MAVDHPGRDALEDRISLLRNVGKPQTLHSQLRTMRREIGRLQRAGYRRTLDETSLALGTSDLPVSLPEASGGGLGTPAGGAGLVPPFTAAEELWVGDGAGVAKLLQMVLNSVAVRRGGALEALAMAANTILLRAGGNVEALSVPASRLVGREASGNTKALTVAQVEGLLTGLMKTAHRNPAVRRLTSTTTLLATDYYIHLAGSIALTLPASGGIADGHTIYVIVESGAGQTMAPNSGQTLNGGAGTKPISLANQAYVFRWNETATDWKAGLYTTL